MKPALKITPENTEEPKLESVSALILAGGEGTRLREVVSEVPKVLAPVNGRPFLHYLLEQLSAFGIRHVVICTGYLGGMVRDSIGSEFAAMKVEYSQEPQGMGTGGAVRLALPYLHSENVLALNGDSYCHADLVKFYRWHCRLGAGCSLAVVERPDAARFGSVEVSDIGRIEKFVEKNNQQTPGSINAGVYLISRTIIESIPTEQTVSLEAELFPRWQSNGQLYGYKSEAAFIDIGTPESYAQAAAFLAALPAAVSR